MDLVTTRKNFSSKLIMGHERESEGSRDDCQHYQVYVVLNLKLLNVITK